MVEVFYLTVALLFVLLLVAAGVVTLRSTRLLDQLPPVLLTGASGAGILLLLSPIWKIGWLTDLALVIATATVGMVLGITRRIESGEGGDGA
jgi:hypothetical protein